MAALSNNVFDSGLDYIDTNTENIHILSADPGLTWSNIALYKLGTKSSPPVNAPSDRAGGGREVIIPAFTDGAVSADGTASHYAITDDSASDILVTGSLSVTQVVTDGNTFSLSEFSVGIPDPA